MIFFLLDWSWDPERFYWCSDFLRFTKFFQNIFPCADIELSWSCIFICPCYTFLNSADSIFWSNCFLKKWRWMFFISNLNKEHELFQFSALTVTLVAQSFSSSSIGWKRQWSICSTRNKFIHLFLTFDAYKHLHNSPTEEKSPSEQLDSLSFSLTA